MALFCCQDVMLSGEGEPTFFRDGKLTLPASDIDALPSKNASVDGPSARPEQRQRAADATQEDVSPWISRSREDAPQFNARHKRPGDRRP